MNIKLASSLLLTSLFLTSGCVFVHDYQNYPLHQIDDPQSKQDQPKLSICIEPSNKELHFPFIYWHWRRGAPYSIRFWAASNEDETPPVLVYSIKLKSGDRIIFDEVYDQPIRLDYVPTTVGKQTYYELKYSHELKDCLEFEEGKEVELDIVLEIPGNLEKTTIRKRGTGTKSKGTSSLWDAYMSI